MRTRKKPTGGRFLVRAAVVAALAAFAIGGAAVAGELPVPETLTEAEAVARGLALPAFADIAQRKVATALAHEREERLWQNPVLSYSREDAGDETEDIALLTQELMLSGSRGLRAQAADHLRSAAEQSAERLRDLRAARIRKGFYSVFLAQERIAATLQWVRQLDVAVQAVARRQAAGDVSAYDRRRVERELHNAESRVATERAALEDAWATVAPLLGMDSGDDGDWPTVVGTLLPGTDPRSPEELAAAVETRADMQALRKEVRAAELQGDAAARGWIPPVTVGAGPKIVDAGGDRDTGFAVSASLPIPVFQRQQAARIRADGEARHALGQLSWRRAAALARLRGAWRNAGRLTEAARSFAEKMEGASAQLVRSAEAAYRGGEIGVLELLDAYRSNLDDELRRLDLEMQARFARIALDVTVGGGPTP